MFFNTLVSKNNNSHPDTLQTNDDIQYTTSSFFTQSDISIEDNWIITACISINKSKVDFTRLNKCPVLHQGYTYKNELSPRLAVQKKFKNSVAVFCRHFKSVFSIYTFRITLINRYYQY